MRVWKTTATLAMIVLILGATLGCSVLGKKAYASNLATVTRGDLLVTAVGSGKTLIANEDHLGFWTAGRIDKIYVKKGDNVSKGDALARLDTADLEQTLTQTRVSLAKQQLSVEQARLALKVAEHSLDEARDLYTWPEIEVAQTDVDEAKAYVEYITTNIAKGGGGGWMSALVYGNARLAAAERKLDAMIHTYDTEEVAIKKMELELAQNTLALSLKLVDEVNGAIKQVERQIDGAVIKAQFDGIVTAVDFDDGDMVSPTVKLIHLLDPASIEVQAEVDEMDVLMVKPGQKAKVRLDAMPGTVLEGTVKSVAQLPTTVSSGLVKYETRIKLEQPWAALKVGLSATSDIVIEEKRSVVLVPNRAIKRGSNGSIVRLAVGTELKDVAVAIGATDGTVSEVLNGLHPGDSVSVQQ